MVYVIDDEEAITDMLQAILSCENIDSAVFNDGYDFLKHKDLLIDNSTVVFMDINMPNINGFKLAEKMIDRFGDVKANVIFMTGDSQLDRDVGFEDYSFLVKPFGIQELLDTIENKNNINKERSCTSSYLC